MVCGWTAFPNLEKGSVWEVLVVVVVVTLRFISRSCYIHQNVTVLSITNTFIGSFAVFSVCFFVNCALSARSGMFPGFVVKTQDHSGKVVADHCFICVLVSFIRRGWARPRAWGRYYGTRIGLGLFLFPPFYLSCHYVSSAVFNDGSSLQAVSGCIAVGGGDAVAAGGLCVCFFFFFLFLFMSHCRQETKKQASHMPRTASSLIV